VKFAGLAGIIPINRQFADFVSDHSTLDLFVTYQFRRQRLT